jgi:nucleotide-binding universal stress UspA family protein
MAFTKILCPVDFSSGSRQAVHAAAQLAIERDAELVLLHVWSVPPSYAGEYTLSGEVVQHLVEDAQRSLEMAVAEARKTGARRVGAKLANGAPWQQIVDAAERERFDLIVIGTHGRTGLARVFLGSVAETVVRHAPCPVLTIPPDGASKPFLHALCPIDFSASSHKAMHLAAKLVQPGGAGITLLHVLELPVPYASEPSAELYRDLEAGSAELLGQWVAELRTKTSVPVAHRTRIGRPGAQVLAALDEDPSFDLIVMGSHGRTGLARIALGSVAEKTVRHARCPVLVARHAPPP